MKTSPLLAALLLTINCPSQAHDNAYFDSHATPHGGQMRMAGPFHLELLMDNGEMTVYVTDHAGTPAQTDSLQAEAIVLNKDGKSRIQLMSGDDAALEAPYKGSPLASDTIVLLMVHTSDGELHEARFTPGEHARK